MGITADGRKLGRKRGGRTALLRNLAIDLIRYEKLTTTLPKARECSRLAEHLISKAKAGDLNARRVVARDIHDTEVMDKIFDVLAKRYANRIGGFTQIFRLQTRSGDNSEMALIKLIA